MREKRKLIFFLPYSLDKDFIKKYDIKNARKFFDIKFFDLKSISQKNKKKNFDLEKNLNNLKKLLKSFKPDFGIMFVHDTFHKQIALFCKKFSNINLIYNNTYLIPENIIIRPRGIFLNLLFSKNLFSNFLYIINKVYDFFCLKKEKKTKYNFDYSIISGLAGKNIKAVNESKKIIKICAEDYKKSFNFKSIKKNNAVFIDEDLFFHRDYSRQSKKKKI